LLLLQIVKRLIKHIVLIAATLLSVSGFTQINKGHNDAVFIENKGQWQDHIFYKMEMSHVGLFFENNALTYAMRDAEKWEEHYGRDLHNHNNLQPTEIIHFAYRAEWQNANLANVKTGNSPRSDYRNYIIGNKPEDWATRVALYKHLVYENVYNNIDVEFYGLGDDFKYNWIVKSGADPKQIATAYSKNVEIKLVNDEVWIEAPTGRVIERAPLVYQMINGVRETVAAGYIIEGNVVSFKLGEYNKKYDLIIDPVVDFSSYVGSTSDNWGFTATYDADGNLYGAGIVFNIGYPITTNNIQSGFNSLPPFSLDETTDLGVTKFNATGTALLYSTYIGGAGVEQPHSMIVNSNNELIIYGTTGSLNFPVKSNGYKSTHAGGSNIGISGFYSFKRSDMFLIKVNPNGTAITGGTFFGGSKNDGINNDMAKNYGDKSRGEVVIDGQDNIYIASSTNSFDLPTTSAASQKIKKFGQDAVVAKFNPSLTQLLWSTYYGGGNDDVAYSLTVNSNGDVYACGGTLSIDLDKTTGAFKSSNSGGYEGWIARFSGGDGALVKTTYLGTSKYDQAFIIDHDKNNGIYVLGQSLGSYPVSANVYSNPNSGQFIHKLSPDLTTSVFSTVFGSGNGGINIVPTAFNIDDCLNIMLSGWGGGTNAGPNHLNGNTFNMPKTNDAHQKSTDGSDFYFMVLANNASSLVYATYFGGSKSEEHVDGGTSRFSPDGNIYQAVCAGCGQTNFPTTVGAWSTSSPSSNCNLGVIKVNFETSITAGLNVDWGLDVDTNCNTLSVNFTNTSRNANQYIWDLGNGITTGDKNPTGVYENFGTYTVVLIAIDTICDISDTVQITFDHDTGVYPVADFVANYVSCDLEREVTIENKSQSGANAFIWDFGDGVSGNGMNPTHKYSSPGTYIITLIARDTTCSNTDTTEQEVSFDYNIPPPEVTVTANPCGDGSVAVEFANDSTWYTYIWEFSDGQKDYNKIPKHKFAITGNYSVHLTIRDTLCNNEFSFDFADYFLISENRLYIPNSFTPNDDGKNEEFIISGNSCLENSEFVILNSFGEEIFITTKPFEEFWDGTYKGQPAQGDVYVYRFVSDTMTKTGYIVLYR